MKVLMGIEQEHKVTEDARSRMQQPRDMLPKCFSCCWACLDGGEGSNGRVNVGGDFAVS
ncbi:hypothetical protein YC2023_047517 [Brassica napus]